MEKNERTVFKGIAYLTNSKETEVSSRRILFARSEEILRSLAGAWAGNREFKLDVSKII